MSPVDDLYPVTCPFCDIVKAYPAPASTANIIPTAASTAPDAPTAYVILNTPKILAFLDHAPISRGHVLVIIREHREKIADLKVDEGQAIGAWLGVISRAVIGSVAAPDADGRYIEELQDDVGDWNIVQNNGVYSLSRTLQLDTQTHSTSQAPEQLRSFLTCTFTSFLVQGMFRRSKPAAGLFSDADSVRIWTMLTQRSWSVKFGIV